MTEGINTNRKIADLPSEVTSSRGPDAGAACDGAKNTVQGFNPHIYENFLCQVESQIESWNRRAVRDPNPEATHALWLKAEGLGYALRLLYAFEPEFRELVECASLGAEIKDPDSTVQHLERKSP